MTALDNKCFELYNDKVAYINLGAAVNLSSEQQQGHVIRVFSLLFLLFVHHLHRILFSRLNLPTGRDTRKGQSGSPQHGLLQRKGPLQF